MLDSIYVIDSSGNCDLDVDECISLPCFNGGTCSESTSDPTIPVFAYSCSCVDGFANGMCFYDYVVEYSADCNISHSMTSIVNATGNCDMDVDECASAPCSHGAGNATCANHVSEWECNCQETINPRTGVREAYDGDDCTNPIDVCAYDEDDCDPLVATCHHLGPGQHTCTCPIGWFGNGSICYDVDECASSPCLNGATCTESSCSATAYPNGTVCEPASFGLPPIDAYTCSCAAGYANGLCDDEWDTKHTLYTDEYTTICTVETGGHCDVDINECVSAPCQNGAGCTDSRETTFTGLPVSFDSYSCACVDGWANGICAYNFISEYASECNLTDSSMSSGNCDMDVDECESSPCVNGATCTESAAVDEIPVHTYRCHCAPGFTHGVCEYDFIPEVAHLCEVQLNARCDVDVDECLSHPCQNGALCIDSAMNAITGSQSWSSASPADDDISIHAYRCMCVPGYANGFCDYDFIAEYTDDCTAMESSASSAHSGVCDIDVDECLSNPCRNGATCTESVEAAVSLHSYQCTCVAGFANGFCEYDYNAEYTAECTVFESNENATHSGNCDVDVDECLSSPCDNGATCSESTVDSSVSPHAYQCTCVAGFANGHCEYTYINEYAAECSVFESSSNLDFGGNCDISVDECISEPCQNGATCLQAWNASEAIPAAAYRCVCVAGFANGLCEYDFIAEFASYCTISDSAVNSSVPGHSLGNCDIDVDECASSPCVNGATCTESAADLLISFHAYQCTCVPGFTNGWCEYDFMPEYSRECAVWESTNGTTALDFTSRFGVRSSSYETSQIGVAAAATELGGNCDIDADECVSGPCQNGALCSDSATVGVNVSYDGNSWSSLELEVSFHAYRCTCEPGYANGFCDYAYITEYTEACTVSDSIDGVDMGGSCDTEVNECTSYPCQNGAACSQSTTDANISLSAYQCTCLAGFTNGFCDVYNYIGEYSAECNVFESTQNATHSGNCDIDVDECASSPCSDGMQCTESNLDDVSYHAYYCTAEKCMINDACTREYHARLTPPAPNTANFWINATFFSPDSETWNEAMPDIAFRINGAVNGTKIYRPCGTDACNATCVWDEVVRYENNRPTIFVPFDDPCFVQYPPPGDEGVHLYASVVTDSAETDVPIDIKMERGVKWSWIPDLRVELHAPFGGGLASGYEPRPMVSSGSTMTSIDVRGYVGVANRAGLDVFDSALQFGEIHHADIYLVPPPPPTPWGDSVLVDDRWYVLAPEAPPNPSESCRNESTPCLNGGVCSDWLWLDDTFVDGSGCICPFEYEHGGHFCEEVVYEEIFNSTQWSVGMYNITLRAGVQNGGASLRWSELVVWDQDECATENGGCGDHVEHWCENRCGAPAICHHADEQLGENVSFAVSADGHVSDGLLERNVSFGVVASREHEVLVHPRPADEELSFEQCHSYVVQANMTNPEEHCNMGFDRLVVDEGGAYHYSVKLGEAPSLGPVQLVVSGEYLQYDVTVIFTEEDFNEPHEITVVVAENLDVTGDYWMDLVHSFSNVESTEDGWWTAREPLIDEVSGWYEGKMWCEASGQALPLHTPMLVVDNDVSAPDELVWQLQTLVQGSEDLWSRGPFTLDESFFSGESLFWNDDMPDAAFRINGAGAGTKIYRPCGADAPAECNTTCVWDEVVRYENNRPTIFVPFDDPCFVQYPPPESGAVDLYAWVSTDNSEMSAVWITMERGIKWSWVPRQWDVSRPMEGERRGTRYGRLNVELYAPYGEWATGYEARPMVDSGSAVTSIDVQSYVGVANRAGLDVFDSALQFGEINPAEIYLVPPPPPTPWGESFVVDDRPYVLYPEPAAAADATCAGEGTACLNGGVCSDWLWLDDQFADGSSTHPADVGFGDAWRWFPAHGCVCPFEYTGHFCETLSYEEVNISTAWAVGVYNITLRAGVQNGGASLRWSELVVWDQDECATENGG
eukprot:SAG11_NODE_709_length_7645_cov_51.686059_2_plen_1938_part_01